MTRQEPRPTTVRRLAATAAIGALLVLALPVAPRADASGPTTLGRTGWQVHTTPTFVPLTVVVTFHGDPQEYVDAPAVPAAGDAGWQDCGASSPLRASPYAGTAPLCPSASTIGMAVGSRLPDCFAHLDFLFFQSFVSIPTGTVISQFSVVMSGADDGARVSIINSAYPSGFVFPGSYIWLGGPQSTTDLSAYAVAGEVNRVVITQVDDCAVANNLISAVINLNGTIVPVADTDLAIGAAPANITTAATSAAGATVTFTAPTASDEGSEAPTVACSPSSGSTFPVGTTTVTCTASSPDDTPSSVSTSFTVTVTDTDLTIGAPPASITTAATSAAGATVIFSAPTASDEDGPVSVSCSPASGSTFPVGTTTVTCTASSPDDTPSSVSTSFTVTVTDNDLAISSHANITTAPVMGISTVVTYTAPTASDEDGPVSVTCNPPSGSTFPLGTTTVTCTATSADDATPVVSTSFTITVPFEFGSAGSFVVGDQTATGAVTFWGAQWANLNALSGGGAPAAFKGFVSGDAVPSCGTSWTSGPGNSSAPPATIPAYIAVVVSSSISKSGSTISGDTVKVVIVQTDPGYDGNPGHTGAGRVIATLCG